MPSPYKSGFGDSVAKVIAELYASYGEATMSMIDGSYVCTIIDWDRNLVFFVRDKLGIARAYRANQDEYFLFSDSLSELLSADNKQYELDPDSIYSFVTIGWVPTPNSMFLGISKIAQGTFFRCHEGVCEEVEYYDVPHKSEFASMSNKDIYKGVEDRLDQAVARGLSSGGNWGSFLSGGIDSSSVVACMSSQNGGGFPTYFGGFAPYLNKYLPNPEEPKLSQMVAEKFKTKHEMLWLEEDATSSIPDIVRALEEPVSDGGCIVLAAVIKKAASEKVDSLMTGIGGDFLYTGERRHKVLNLLGYMRVLPNFVWTSIAKLFGVPPFSWFTRLSQIHFDLTKLLGLRGLDLETMYAGFFIQAEPVILSKLLKEDFTESLSRPPRKEMDEYFAKSEGMDPQSRFLYLDLKMQTPDHCVREVECLGRYYGISTYHPFLDSDMVDYAMSIPSESKVSGLELKVPLKKAMEGRVPHEILYRKKGGLGSPIRWWVTQKDGFVADVLSRENIERRGYFSADTIEELRSSTEDGKKDFTRLLWSLYTLEVWMQEFVDKRYNTPPI